MDLMTMRFQLVRELLATSAMTTAEAIKLAAEVMRYVETGEVQSLEG